MKRGNQNSPAGKLAGTEVLYTGANEPVELPIRWISDKEKSVDFTGCNPCPHCQTHTGPDGQLAGHIGKITLYYIDPHGVWVSMTAACPRCEYGAFAAKERRDGFFYKPASPFADRCHSSVPDLSAEEWRLLGACHATKDTYLDAANRISSSDEFGEIKAGIIRKLGG